MSKITTRRRPGKGGGRGSGRGSGGGSSMGEKPVAEGGHPTRQALQAIYHAACVAELEAATQLPGMANHKVTLQAVLQVWTSAYQ